MTVKFANVEIEPQLFMDLCKNGERFCIIDVGRLGFTMRSRKTKAIHWVGQSDAADYVLDLSRPWRGRKGICGNNKYVVLHVCADMDGEEIVTYRSDEPDDDFHAAVPLHEYLALPGQYWEDKLDA